MSIEEAITSVLTTWKYEKTLGVSMVPVGPMWGYPRVRGPTKILGGRRNLWPTGTVYSRNPVLNPKDRIESGSPRNLFAGPPVENLVSAPGAAVT